MGTEILAKGKTSATGLQDFNITAPELIQSIHQSYKEAGSEFFLTHSFTCHPVMLKELKSPYPLKELITQAVKNLQTSAPQALHFASIGPCFLDKKQLPKASAAIDGYAQVFQHFEDSGLDSILCETIGYTENLRWVLEAIRHSSKTLKFAISLCTSRQGTLLDDSPLENALPLLNEAPLSFAGVNCGTTLPANRQAIEILSKNLDHPLIFRPNKTGDGTMQIEDKNFAQSLTKNLPQKVKFLGACCGATPQTIKAIKENLY
ncbi:MAG: homocysteine S-methyltransferase family protein [Deltaproteobacteria bacterium]|nr:homocysteine S-methyltransferase family protein [Deltaproteobacteria bacterium]